MKNTGYVALTLLLTACGGAKANETADTTAQPAGDVVAECEASAEVAKKEAALFRDVTPSNLDSAIAAYNGMQRSLERWSAEDAPCAREGASVTDRMAVQQEVEKELAAAQAEGTAKLVRHLEPNVDAARDFLDVVFASGRAPSDTVLDAAHSVDRRYRERLMTKFREAKAYGQLDDALQTTCIFAETEIDPQVEAITENFKSIFEGKRTEVHAVCRLPLPANKYGGDAQGKLMVVLDDDADLNNGTIYEGDLGAPEKWNETRYFKARFDIPQGPAARKDAGVYYVTMKAQRPQMGNETLVSNRFYWHR